MVHLSASSFSSPALWTSSATPFSCASVKSPLCARYNKKKSINLLTINYRAPWWPAIYLFTQAGGGSPNQWGSPPSSAVLTDETAWCRCTLSIHILPVFALTSPGPSPLSTFPTCLNKNDKDYDYTKLISTILTQTQLSGLHAHKN